ncbi:MAG: C40 family peptidase [Bacteroidota bacterium]|nr:C40 family peptidase [Bacteroidota bacterium]
MKFGFCNLSHVPVRKSTTSKSEMVTQLLFGDTFEIIDTKKNWLLIRNSFDSYEGWINDVQFCPISFDTYIKINTCNNYIITDLIAYITDTTNNLTFPIVRGSVIPLLNKENTFEIEDKIYILDEVINKNNSFQIRDIASKYLNSPYLWGGRSPFGIDCSGFTQAVFRFKGINLHRDANQQAEQGENVNSISEAKENDLAFFDNDEGNIIHVGIILSENKIIHASGKVRIDNIDHKGIYNHEKKEYSHRLKLIKRII